MKAIEFLTMRESRVPFMRKDVFALNKKRNHLWLQKICIGILKRLDCYWWDETVEVTRVQIDAPTFMDRLYKQKRELFRHFNQDGKTLLIGAQDYEEMMHCPQINREFKFNASVYMGAHVVGLKVQVIPWMSGAVVMP